VLLIPLLRFLPPSDPRVGATVLAIADELTVNGLVLRYRPEETDDGLGSEEGSFTICSFWLVSALAEIGELPRAHRLCERLLGLASPLGLFGEEIDPGTGRHLGNFPQAFTHLALINAVMHLIDADARRPEEPLSMPRDGHESELATDGELADRDAATRYTTDQPSAPAETPEPESADSRPAP
jgi:GH15 family glucan-1,4-alpha-glucosidase